jgi:hypothetical protein
MPVSSTISCEISPCTRHNGVYSTPLVQLLWRAYLNMARKHSNRQIIYWLTEKLLVSFSSASAQSMIHKTTLRHLCQSASVDSTPETPHATFLLAAYSVHSPDARNYENSCLGTSWNMACRRNKQWIHVWKTTDFRLPSNEQPQQQRLH